MIKPLFLHLQNQPNTLRRTPVAASALRSPQTVDSLINSIIASQTPRQQTPTQVIEEKEYKTNIEKGLYGPVYYVFFLKLII